MNKSKYLILTDMSIKRLFLISLVSIFSISMFSCDVEEEETNVKFQFNYITRLIDEKGEWFVSDNKVIVIDEYYTYKDSNVMYLKGYTTKRDSIEMRLKNLEKKALTPGTYDMTSGLKSFNLTYYQEGNPTFPINGHASVTYVNSRIDFSFYGYMNNSTGDTQYSMENGIGENLDLYNPHTDTLDIQ